MGKTGFALIGCGLMGSRLAERCARLEQAGFVGVWDRNPSAAQELGSRLNVAVFKDLRALLHSPNVNAVLIATPPMFHRRYVCAAARAGKHVFCEKPMAASVGDCSDMIVACRRSGVKLMIGHLARFHPVLSYVHRTVRKGVLGDPICIVVRRLGGPWSEGGWHKPWRLKRNESGGALLEINSHELDFLRLVGGEVASVYAIGGKYRQFEADYADQILVNIKFASGVLGHLHSSQASAMGAYGGRVDCTKGSILFPSVFAQSPVVHMSVFGEKPHVVGPEEFADTSPVEEELKAFIAAIESDSEPLVTGKDGRSVVELALASYESLDSGRVIALPLR